ncbi:DUF4279 domain-containing protein [Flavobacterium buctense]|uniref:DUF4279 domain-containing protein n=1 Tax=Flavobacterium buctense TaxID=1648146 RepID=A0ABU9E459_9FLAO|nr:DUF4279 domain-containing protein [Flavobacterium buctense]
MNNPYNDNYPTCGETYATLRIYSKNSNVVERLEIKPSDTSTGVDFNGYFYSTKEILDSKDIRRHIDYLIEKFRPKIDILKKIQSEGSQIDISCYWLSKDGHGGPTLSPNQLTELGKLNVDIWFDIYSV